MKKIITCFIGSFFICCISIAQTKRALIIAIGKYPASSGWEELNSVNDVPLLKNALLKQDFTREHIGILTDSMATKTGIESAIDKLIESSHAGDIVVIFFSSHGEQLEDDNGDEIDGLDESIVPYDAIYSADKKIFKKLANNYFRDDAFGKKITLLRNKLGKKGNILVGIDACHSGTATRGSITKVRGNKEPMTGENFDQKKFGLKDSASVFIENNKTRSGNNAATYVVISASQAKEKNNECYDDEFNPVGSLSYSLSKALGSLDSKTTYRNLFAQVEDEMRNKVPQQTPVIEGDGIDFELFGGKYVQQELYYTVNAKLSNSKNIFLNAGAVAGITVGCEVKFFPAGTIDPGTSIPLQKGMVTFANNFSSTVKLENENAALLKRTVWAFVAERSYGNNKILLGIDSLKTATGLEIKEGLKDFQLVEFKPVCDIYFSQSMKNNGIELRYANSGVLVADGLHANDIQGLKTVLKRFDRYRYLRNLKFNEQGLSAKVELVFLDKTGNIDLKKMKSRQNLGRLELKAGDSVFLKIINTGTKDFYINIVDMQPDGIINPVIPNKKLVNNNMEPDPIKWQDCEVKSRSELFFKNKPIIIAPPYAEETFKIFLSTEPLDLEEILTGNGNNSHNRGVLNDLVKIFEGSAVNETGIRSGTGKINTTQNGTVFSFNFRILPE